MVYGCMIVFSLEGPGGMGMRGPSFLVGLRRVAGSEDICTRENVFFFSFSFRLSYLMLSMMSMAAISPLCFVDLS